MKTILLSLLLFYSCYASTKNVEIDINDGDLKLELVQVLIRHGARTPEQAEIDICNFTQASWYEPFGLGELNNEGKRQGYRLGKFLRDRYNNYLRRFYKPEDVYAYSSAMGRRQMSLQLALAGLYPPTNPAVWNRQLKWSPIPYITVPEKLDILLESHLNPKFQESVNQVLVSDQFKKKFAKFSGFFKFIKERITITDNVTISDIVSTFQVLTSNEYMNLPLPDWYTSKVKESFIDVDTIRRDAYVATLELKKIGFGFLIKTFIQNMNLNKTFNNPRKIYLYENQLTNIASFIRIHNITKFRYASHGSALIIEKLSDSKDRVYVRLLAWEGADGVLTTLKLGKHMEFCPIEDYLKMVENVIPSEKEINAMLGNLTAEQMKELFFVDDKVTLVKSRLKWSPIPYVYVPLKSDILLESYKTSTFRSHLYGAINSDEFKKSLAEFSDLFEFIFERTIVNNPDPFWGTHSTFDILAANEFMNMSTPDWYTPEVRAKLFKVEELMQDILVATSQMKKIGVGKLIKTFVENMNFKGTIVHPKRIYIYSGHDANIAMFTRAHNIREFLYPDFGSALIFEKLTDSEDRIYVRLLAWDGAGKLVTLKLNNSDFCPIEDYLKIVEGIIPSEREIDEVLRNMK